MQAFIDVVDTNSFNKAAEKRFTSPAGITRRIHWLEQQLGVRLLQRTTRRLQLTEEGKYFYGKSKIFLGNLAELTQQLQTQKRALQGPLKITMPVAFAEVALFNQLLNNFMQQNPQIELTLDFANQNRELINHEIDVAIRASRYDNEQYTSVPILQLKRGIYAAPNYLKQKGIPRTPAELAQHNCLLHHFIGLFTWHFSRNHTVTVNGNVKANSSRGLIELCKLGLGCIQSLEIYVAEELNNNTLQPILESDWPEPIPIYMVYRNDVALPLRVQAFVDYGLSYFGCS